MEQDPCQDPERRIGPEVNVIFALQQKEKIHTTQDKATYIAQCDTPVSQITEAIGNDIEEVYQEDQDHTGPDAYLSNGTLKAKQVFKKEKIKQVLQRQVPIKQPIIRTGFFYNHQVGGCCFYNNHYRQKNNKVPPPGSVFRQKYDGGNQSQQFYKRVKN